MCKYLAVCGSVWHCVAMCGSACRSVCCRLTLVHVQWYVEVLRRTTHREREREQTYAFKTQMFQKWNIGVFLLKERQQFPGSKEMQKRGGKGKRVAVWGGGGLEEEGEEGGVFNRSQTTETMAAVQLVSVVHLWWQLCEVCV